MQPTVLFMAFRIVAVAFGGLVTSTAAAQHQITYDRVVFDRSNNAEDLGWSQLFFAVEGFLIDGLCYHNCDIEFSLDGAPRGPYQDRADVRVTRGLVTSTFPTDFYGQMFIGNRQNTGAERDAIAAFREREKLALAWIIEHSAELIAFAVASGRVSRDTLDYWRGQEVVFEGRLARAFATVLNGYRNQIETRNTPDQTRDIVQPALAEVGLYSGPIDGIPGSMTREAVAEFQQERGRLVTGYANGEERALMEQMLEGEIEEDVDTRTHTERLAERLGVDLESAVTPEDVALDAAVELTRLQAEVARLEAASEMSRRVAANRLETIRTLGRELREAYVSADRAAAELARLQSEVVRLQAEVARLEAASEMSRRVAANRLETIRTLGVELREARVCVDGNPETEIVAALHRELEAANETIADLRESTVPIEQVAQIANRLEVANATITNLRQARVPTHVIHQIGCSRGMVVPDRGDLAVR